MLIASSNRRHHEDWLAPRSGVVGDATGFGISLVRVDGTFLRPIVPIAAGGVTGRPAHSLCVSFAIV